MSWVGILALFLVGLLIGFTAQPYVVLLALHILGKIRRKTRHRSGGFTGPPPPEHWNCRCRIQPIEDAMTKTRTPTPTLDFSQAPTITMTPVEGSSQIAEEGHDPDTSTLRLRFHGFGGKPGSLYDYANFGATDYAVFRDAESKGSHFIRNIKPNADRYPCTRIIETAAP